MLCHVGQGVLADEVLLDRFICGGRQVRGLSQHARLQWQEVAEDTGHGDHHVDAGAIQRRVLGSVRRRASICGVALAPFGGRDLVPTRLRVMMCCRRTMCDQTQACAH